MEKDFLGKEIKAGQRAIFHGPYEFKKATILEVNTNKPKSSFDRHLQTIKIQCDGQTKPGWTFPSSIVIIDKI